MGASITLAGESLIAQKQGQQQVLTVARFILASVPGLDPSQPVNRAAGKPPQGQIVGTYDVTQSGYVNPNQVIYSLMLGSDVGDFDWNWIGLETADNVLLAVATVGVQQKRRNIPPLQIGNNVTRNFMVVFDGAQALTGITIDATTWQHDFTVRLAGIDERERQSNRDIFGRACFLGDALKLEKVGQAYQLKPGIAYVEGIRVSRSAALPVVPPALPAKAWLDVALQRELSDVVTSWQVVWGSNKADYTDSTGVRHYCVPLADLPSSTTITDQRTVEPITGPLVGHFAARNGDYEGLRARATTKQDIGLGELPNAKSDDPATNSSEILATTAALQAGMGQVVQPLAGMIATFARETPPAGWLKANGATVSRTTYSALFAAIGTRFGAGNGTTTFRLPDARGEFLRGWDDGRGIDVARELGSLQDGQNASHTHTASAAAAGGHSHTASTANAGSHTHAASTGAAGGHSHTASTGSAGEHVHPLLTQSSTGATSRNMDTTSQKGLYSPNENINGTPLIQEAGAHTHTVSVSAVAAHTHTVSVASDGDHAHTVTVNAVADHAHAITVNASGGNEARPRNLAILACIKF